MLVPSRLLLPSLLATLLFVAPALATAFVASTPLEHHGLTTATTTTTARETKSLATFHSLVSSKNNQNKGTALGLLSIPRGGAVKAAAASSSSSNGVLDILSKWNKDPTSLFNYSLIALVLTTCFIKVIQSITSVSASTSSKEETPEAVSALQFRYLPIFWLFRMAFWMSGPYLFAVYASKTVNGAPATMDFISKIFLTQFASIALFGPIMGSASDQYGRKKASIAAAIIYTLGALSTTSSVISILFLGRALGGVGTSLLQSAPESWLVSEADRTGAGGKYLGQTFGLAYAGDSIVAILAGQVAGWAAAQKGPVGPFVVSPAFLAVGSLIAALFWKENVAPRDKGNDDGPSLKDALKVALQDPKILMVGSVQALFEAAMYVFVLQWPQDMGNAIKGFFGSSAATPFGTAFSCFMACSLLGATFFGQLAKWAVPVETSMTAMLLTATAALGASTLAVAGGASAVPLAKLMGAFFVFEACVGMYFPSIGTLRGKYLPDSHRSGIMNLFGVPLNLLVVSVYLTISKLGSKGAYGISTTAVGIATLCMMNLNRLIGKKE